MEPGAPVSGKEMAEELLKMVTERYGLHLIFL
jgi:hypothetical protein